MLIFSAEDCDRAIPCYPPTPCGSGPAHSQYQSHHLVTPQQERHAYAFFLVLAFFALPPLPPPFAGVGVLVAFSFGWALFFFFPTRYLRFLHQGSFPLHGWR